MINTSKKYVQAYFNGLPNMIRNLYLHSQRGVKQRPPYNFLSLVKGGSRTFKGGLNPPTPWQIDHWLQLKMIL